MAERTRTPLAFGGGVDRGSGPLVVQAASFADLRNVNLSEGWMSVRLGMLREGLFDSGEVDHPVTDIIGIAGVRSQGITVIITYNSPTMTCAAWSIAGPLDTPPVWIADFWTIPGGGTVPPLVTLAVSYDKVFVAHDEPIFADRQVTQVVDINAATVANLNPGGSVGQPKFRGVCTHLAYLVGWGWGLVGDEDRPEIVRTSIAGDPLSWDVDHYFVVGQRGDPVIACCPCGSAQQGILIARKESESYDIVGYSRDTFGIFPGDGRFGIAGSRLSCKVGTVNYFWSLEGPRASSGPGESADISFNLALASAPVDLLAANLDYARGFAVYQPVTREVWFVFGAWAFVLHLMNEGAKRWSYRAFGDGNVPLACGGDVANTEELIAPDAHAEMAATIVTDTTIDQTANIVGSLLGGESVEWWLLDPNVLIWQLIDTSPVGLLDTTAEFTYTGLLPGLGYIMAVRIKRNGLAGPGYTSPNPNTWPATARKTATTLAAPGEGDPPPDPAPDDLAYVVTISDTADDSSSVDVNGHVDGTLDGTETIDWFVIFPIAEILPRGTTGPPILADNAFSFTGLDAATDYVFAARLSRAGTPTTPYTSFDPWSWPPESRVEVSTEP